MVVTAHDVPLILVLALLAGCATPAPAPRPATSAEPVSMYVPAGSKQCSGGGKSLDAAKRELTDAGVSVVSAQCGTDGQMYATSCGMPDGGILIVKVAPNQVPKAWQAGWRMLADLPEAKVRTCR